MKRLTLFALIIGIMYWYGFDHARIILNAQELSDFQKAAYDDHNLNGKDGWSDGWNTLLIDDTVLYAGKRSIRNQQEVGGLAYKELDQQFVDTGVLTFFVKVENNSYADDQPIAGIFKGVGEEFIALLRFSNNFNDSKDGLLLSRAGSTETIAVGEVAQGFWHKVSLGWRAEDYSFRVKIDYGAWSPWFQSQTTWGNEESFGVRVSLPPALEYGDFYINGLAAFVGVEDINPPLDEEVVDSSEEDFVSPPEVQEELSLFDQVLSGTLTSTSREFPEENEVVLEEAETSLPEEDSPATSIESTSSPEESVSADVDAQMPSEAPLVLDLTPSVTDPLESIIPEPITTEF